ncbi:MAG: nuclear transport factor 2 family protein [Burkholderiales bacterium]
MRIDGIRAMWRWLHPGIVEAGSGAMPCTGTISVDEALAAEAARYRAQEANDFAALERMLGDDLVYIHSSTNCDTKASYLGSLRSGAVRYRRMTLGDVTVRCYGALAVLSGRTAFEVTAGGQDLSLDLLFHALWAQRSGGPQFVSWQATRLPART